MQDTSRIGPTILSTFRAFLRTSGILNMPKSVPEKYGTNEKIRHKRSSTTPNGSGNPDILKRLNLSAGIVLTTECTEVYVEYYHAEQRRTPDFYSTDDR